MNLSRNQKDFLGPRDQYVTLNSNFMETIG